MPITHSSFLPKLERCAVAFLALTSVFDSALSQHIPEANRISGVEKLRGITGLSVEVRVNRKGNDYEDTSADARLKASLEGRLRAAGFTVYKDDDNFPILRLQVLWDAENNARGDLIGCSCGEVMTVMRALPAPKEGNSSGRSYMPAHVWYNIWEDFQYTFDLQGAFEKWS